MKKEEWKTYIHPETSKKYQISSFAKVVSKDFAGNKYEHTTYKNNGYRCIPFRKPNGKNGLIYLHKIMANLFVENPHAYKKIKFKNGDSANCMAHNLEWISREEAAEMNRKQLKPYDIYPNYAPNTKLSTARVAIIKKRIRENEKSRKTRWSTLAKQFKISPRHLWQIRTGRIWANVKPA
ncbi:MAG: NUMOD4 domain-containing protein [Bacteroidota bacterium]